MHDFGPLAPFMADPDVKEIIVEGVRATVVTGGGAREIGALCGRTARRSSVSSRIWSMGRAGICRSSTRTLKTVIRQQETMVSCNVDGGLLFAVKPPAAPYRLHIWKDRKWPTLDVDAMATATADAATTRGDAA